MVAIATGMGTDLATQATDALFARVPDIKRVIVFGITGAVTNETPIGALIVPERVLNSETGVAYTPTISDSRALWNYVDDQPHHTRA